MFDRSRETSLNKPSRDKSNSVLANHIYGSIHQDIRPVHLLQRVLIDQV
jgi:hypothetical protein